MTDPQDIDVTLVALGFRQGEAGTLIVPADSVVRLIPTGKFYELNISLGDGNAVTAVLSRTALKFSRVGVTR
ncbi:MAG TPA: hypothetical protein VM910_10630 [Bradyrhizobium sp.]|jgi:hypothetical protein|nr:hypothetical protein [Bradyrhizobium sp.]